MWKLLKESVNDFMDDDCPQMSAALAYYTMFSLAPLLLIVLAICGLFLDAEHIRGQVFHEITSVAGESAARQIEDMLVEIDASNRGTWTTALSVVTLVFGATGTMVQLQLALNRTWSVEPATQSNGLYHFLLKRLLSFAMLLGIAFILLVSLTVSWILKSVGEELAANLPAIDSPWIWIIGHELVLWLVATVLFAAMLKFLPDATIHWSDVILGAAITATLFVIGKFGISFYLSQSNMTNTFGAAGSLVLVLVWVYYSAMIFLFGAEITENWATYHRRDSEAEPGARKLDA